MGLPQTIFATLAEVFCCNCGMRFWVDEYWEQTKRANGANFHCPNGHPLAYKDTTVDVLKKQLAEKEAELARERTRVELRDKTNAALRGQITKVKNRVQNGVCPCCNRSFTNLRRHMGTKHPGWKKQEIG